MPSPLYLIMNQYRFDNPLVKSFFYYLLFPRLSP